MKKSLRLLIVALGASGPLLACAQTSQGLTRDQVRQDLIDYQRAGYNPARQNPQTWVEDVQAASARVTAERNGFEPSQLAQNRDADHCN